MIAPLPLVRRGAAALSALSLAAGLVAQQPTPPTPPNMVTPPADAVPTTLFSLPDDLEVTLWAKAPMLRNPSNMDIDAQGRVWITEAVNYRKLAGKDPEGDRVIILEDTDGDGVADKTSVFVQEPALLAPLGIAVIDNKIIVSCAPDIIVYTDVDRDGKFDARIDKREVLLTGFNGRNHDHSLHSVTFGPDGKFYFNHGNCSAQFTDRSGRTFRIGSSYDPKGSGAVPIFNWNPKDLAGAMSDDGHVYTGGFTVRMNPDATNAEIIGYNYRNSYEQTVTSFGDVFHNDNDDPPAARTSFLMEYGNTGFFSRDGRRTWQADKRPGQTTAIAEWRQQDPGTIPVGDVYGNGAPTGIASYESDALGAKWRGMILSCETARNVVFGYFPKVDGAGYKLDRFDFFTSNPNRDFAGIDSQRGKTAPSELKTWFRPSDVAVGPDGAIYVADWFDPRTGGHSALDNSFAGAIYRITPKGKKLTTPKLDVTTTAGQIAALKSPAVNVRALGFNALKAQGAAAVPAVAALLSDENPFVRARAIFLLAQLGAPGVAKVEGVLKSADAQERVAAFRALRRAGQPILARAKTLATDSAPTVRREVALALRDTPAAQAKDILLAVAKGYDGQDRAYLEAWGTGCTGKESEIYAALAATAPSANAATWSPAYANLVWRLTPRGAEGAFAARAAAEKLPEADRLAAVTALGFIPSREAVMALLDLAEKAKGAVKNHAFWWVINYKDIRWKEFGVDAALKQRGLYDPSAATIAEMLVPAAPETKLVVADIAKLTGNVANGEAAAARCLVCHRIGDQGVDYAPALTGFAKAQTTEVVINAIVNPSAEIAHGYEGTQVTLKDGSVVHGLMLSSGDPLVIQSMGGVTQLIPGSKVRNKSQLGRSLMLSADQLNLSAQEVADVVAYLKTK